MVSPPAGTEAEVEAEAAGSRRELEEFVGDKVAERGGEVASFPVASSGGGLASLGDKEEEESKGGSEEERGEGERATVKDDELRRRLV